MKNNSTVELIEILFKTSRLMKNEMSFTHNLVHLSILQVQTLIFLNQDKKIYMSDIAAYFHIELPSATSLLNKLYLQKLVERQTDKEDRRLVRITLTNKGKTLLDQVIHERKKKLEKMLSYLSEKEKDSFLKILRTLSDKLEKNQ